MEKAKPSTSIISNVKLPCPSHPHLPIQRVNPENFVDKTLYCLECLLQTDNGCNLYKTLPTIENYISQAAGQFASDKAKAKPNPNIPQKYLDIVATKGETLETLTKHLEQEKTRIRNQFAELTAALIEVIEKVTEDYLKVFDEQIANLCNNLSAFERELESGYPSEENILTWFPTLWDLQKSMDESKDAAELEYFINSVKMLLHRNKHEVTISRQSEAIRTKYFDDFVENLKKMESKRPSIDLKGINVIKLKTDFQKLFKPLTDTITLINPIQPISGFSSTICTPRDFSIIKAWIPYQYSDLTFELIYRVSRDGPAPETFHKMCDGKGPTVTIIKCKFNGSNENAVIGGFLDKDWHKKNAPIPSNDAFLFSLTSCLKCPCIQTQNAANGYADSGPNFGAGNDLRIATILTDSYVNPTSYQNSGRLVLSEDYKGSGMIRFTPLEVEVFKLR